MVAATLSCAAAAAAPPSRRVCCFAMDSSTSISTWAPSRPGPTRALSLKPELDKGGTAMQTIRIPGTDLEVSRIALGTWAIGGWMWGGTEERRSIDTIHAAIDKGINLIDTAPVYGFGTSEKIVGKAIKEYGKREDLTLITKVGPDWKNDFFFFKQKTAYEILRSDWSSDVCSSD